MKQNDLSNKTFHKKNRFLLRNLVLGQDSEMTLRKIKINGLYPREITELEKEEENAPYELNKHIYLNKKSVKGLHKVQLNSFKNFCWLNNLKNAKNLKNLKILIGKEDLNEIIGFPNVSAKVSFVFQCLKKLSKYMKSIMLYIEDLSVKKGHVRQVYRTLASFRHLDTLSRLLGFNQTECYLEDEYRWINRYMPLLRSLKEFEYDYCRYEKICCENEEMVNLADNTYLDQRDFQKIVRKNIPCPWITTLSLAVVGEYFETYDALRASFIPEKSDQGDDMENKEEDWLNEETIEGLIAENANGNDDLENDHPPEPTEEEKIEMAKEEIIPFYRYDIFPHLRKLILQNFNDCLYPLDSFVIEGFAALKYLEQIDLNIEKRPVGTKFIFLGLLKLPLLNFFSLEIPFIKEEEWELLGDLFAKQPELVSFNLIIPKVRSTKKGYLNQNETMKSLWKYLEDKPNLQYLGLKISGSSLESLSEGLKETKLINQLKSFDFEAFDDSTTPKSPLERIEGLCNFIRRQKDSLLYLTINLPFVLEVDIVDHIAQAICELTELREMDLNINHNEYAIKTLYINLYEKTLEKENPIKTRKNNRENQRSWYPQIAEMLMKLNKLEDLAMYFGRIDKVDKQFVNDFLMIVEALPTMKTLKGLEFNIPFHELKAPARIRAKSALLKLTNVSSVSIDTDELESEKVTDEIEEIVDQVNQRQSLRVDKMF